MLPSGIVIMLLLGFAGAVRFEELVDAARQVAQDAGGALELLVQHHAGLPVHGAPQIMGQLKRILQSDTNSALVTSPSMK